MILGIVLGVLFFLLLIWLCAKYFILIGSDRIARQAFDNLHPQINKRYNFILNTLSAIENSENAKLASDTRALITKALDYTANKDGIDRIIRFANAIFENSEQLSILPENDTEFEKAKSCYNISTAKLRHAVDVFPTSLMARFADIKTLDCLK